MAKYDKLFETVKIGSMVLKNRFIQPPMVVNYCSSDGHVTDRYIAYIRARAKGGVGMIVTEATYVHSSGKGFINELGIYKDELIPGLKKLTAAVHEEGGKIAVQLYHGGRQTSSATTGMPIMAPSPIPCPFVGEMPKEMTEEDIREIVEAYGEGARRAKDAGFDAVEIHGAHGYLINQFLSPYSNKRSDEYGGSLINRARFPLAVVQKVREIVGPDFPVQYRMSAEEYVEGGLTVEDTKAFSIMLVDNSVNAIHVSGGVYESAAYILPPAAIPQGVYVNNAAAIREAIGAKVPVIVAARLKNPDMMVEIVEAGKADMISIGRTLLADPEFPNKLKTGKLEDIRKCTGCNQGCVDRLLAAQDIGCLGNPLTGHEGEFNLEKKAANKKKVLVVGGGPGGLEAARIATLGGHNVFLYEKSDKLGGLLNCVSLAPHKDEFEELKNFQIAQIEKLGVHVTLNQSVDGAVIDRLQPDVVIMATGSQPIKLKIPGLENVRVKNGEEILFGATFGKSAVVIGGGAVGCETAEFMADKGAKVIIVEMQEEAAKEVGLLERALLLQRLAQKGVTILTGGAAQEVTAKGELIIKRNGGEEILRGIDTVVLAVGYKSVTELEDVLKEKEVPYVKIGDCSKPRKVLDATWEAFHECYSL
ncbi:MAG TPA: FAD-dependent oxidoreductase [Methylomusa anaerophila]|uniref:NADH oxidase n=1 Tax=Methylomusa anaerophila TaxID=1930071 RepID=A0A348AGM4_9FIRM|nr:FAD-dependent oxidoreductase [Methylomusa anaerophila]BBB90222.1 NADH oxidase [Methylomusa anaerophila]HML90738.1 FAD-dependent oxidoreductase [Methylomusa anaerophila]